MSQRIQVTNLRTWAELTVVEAQPLLSQPEERVALSCIGLRVEGSRKEVARHLLAAAEAYREAARLLQQPGNNVGEAQ